MAATLRRGALLAALGSAGVCLAGWGQAQGAGTAFGVDTSEVSEPGSCKVETWVSRADNQDTVVTANPACVIKFGTPIEVSAQIVRARAEGEWATSITPKAKARIRQSEIGSFGLALAAGSQLDAISGEQTTIFAYVPATLRLSEMVRINVNGGWLLDRVADQHYLTYGLGVDWKLTDMLTLTVETFGQAGRAEEQPVTSPRFQAGLRLRPIDTLSLDLIYGRNINGEDANWITAAVTVRFPPR
ncbi:MAG: hypothetical protein NW223_08580 [Hyphomicrobiaceae bacterium]|nr:hypothetical protein [Hyphomicrobiaceae bacterium]